MNIKIYPKKAIFILSCIFIIYSLGIFFIIMSVNKIIAIKILVVSFVLLILVILIDLIIESILLNDEVLIIKANGNSGFKKKQIPLKNIDKIEIVKIKLSIATDTIFNIYYKELDEEKVLRINQNAYFFNDLHSMFNLMGTKKNIVFDNNSVL